MKSRTAALLFTGALAAAAVTACASSAHPPAQQSHVVRKYICGTHVHPLYCIIVTAPPSGTTLVYAPVHLYRAAIPGAEFDPVTDIVSSSSPSASSR